MLAWGDNSIGYFHGNGREIMSPTELPKESPTLRNLKALAVGEYQCCVLSTDGSVTIFGTTCNGSSSHEISTSSKITAFETLNIVDVFAGGSHMFAVTDDGRAYGWGGNNFGQLGWKDESGNSVISVPKSVRRLPSKRVVQISCGLSHTLVLLHDGSIYAMGDNSYGQLGIGTYEPTSEPTEVTSLRGLPIAQIAASGWHSFCVTVSGRVFCWGRNDFGQLGLGDRANRKSPSPLRMLRSHAVKFIAGGDYHSAVLTQDGGVFTFGSSCKGQLGHGSISESEVNPRKVFELMGSVVTQVACGKLHTIAYVPDSGNVFTCGSGERGQLGLGTKIDSLQVPTVVKGPWRQSTSPFYNISRILACGNQSFVIVGAKSVDYRDSPEHRQIWRVNSDLCERASRIGDAGQIPVNVLQQLECIMSSQSCMNASFLAQDHHTTSSKYPGVSLMTARLLFSKLMKCGNKKLIQKVESYLAWYLIPSLPPNPPDIEALRLYITLPEFKIFRNPDFHDSLLFPFVEKLLNLAENPSKILDQWYRSLDSDFFLTPVEMCQDCIVSTIKRGLPPDTVKRMITLLLNLMRKLNKVNNSGESCVVDFRKFYIPELNDLIPLESDYQQWARTANQDFSFCRYPFVFNSKAKTLLLQIDSKFQMNEAFLHARGQNVAAIFGLGMGGVGLESPVIEVEIRRERLVEDAIRGIRDNGNLKRPFIVKFVGEDGQDAGGVRKEFFMLILREILDPKYGMFRNYDDSNLLWFSDFGIETDDTYHLIGTLCGLAVYNSTIIDISFPLALYKKLLDVQPTLSDLKELDPVVGNSLQQLVDFVEDDGSMIEDIFCLNFTITRDHFGTTACKELIENGENIAVTGDNRSQYVSAYLDYVFNKSIESQFECFKKGFLRVCGGQVLNLFRPEELMEMVVGNQNYNWEELEKKTVYKGEYWRNHKVIVWFWEVFHALTVDEKKEFVRFLTGSSKIPINGLEFCIQPLPFGDDYLPVAHTCFNILDLPRYTNRDALKTKLKLAIRSEGFFLA